MWRLSGFFAHRRAKLVIGSPRYLAIFDVMTILDRRIEKVASTSYLDDMLAIGLKTLKNKLAEYVRLVASGETVLVTDRDRVVAELVPPRSGRSDMASDALLAEAVRKGWITPPLLTGSVPAGGPPVAPLAQLLDELNRDRGER